MPNIRSRYFKKVYCVKSAREIRLNHSLLIAPHTTRISTVARMETTEPKEALKKAGIIKCLAETHTY